MNKHVVSLILQYTDDSLTHISSIYAVYVAAETL